MGYFANGTEGAMFEERYCSRCVHSDLLPGREIGVDPPCPIWVAHLLYAYEHCNDDPNKSPIKATLDSLIEIKMIEASDGVPTPVNECKMFHPHDGTVIPGQLEIGGDSFA